MSCLCTSVMCWLWWHTCAWKCKCILSTNTSTKPHKLHWSCVVKRCLMQLQVYCHGVFSPMCMYMYMWSVSVLGVFFVVSVCVVICTCVVGTLLFWLGILNFVCGVLACSADSWTPGSVVIWSVESCVVHCVVWCWDLLMHSRCPHPGVPWQMSEKVEVHWDRCDLWLPVWLWIPFRYIHVRCSPQPFQEEYLESCLIWYGLVPRLSPASNGSISLTCRNCTGQRSNHLSRGRVWATRHHFPLAQFWGGHWSVCGERGGIVLQVMWWMYLCL